MPFYGKYLLSLALVVLAFLPANVEAGGKNLILNSGAEKVKGGVPIGFGCYVGAGEVKLVASNEKPHSGQAAARLALDGWYESENKPKQINGFLMFGRSNGYQSDGAFALPEKTLTVAYDFWVRGSENEANLQVWWWDKAGNRVGKRVKLPPIKLTDQWQRVTGRYPFPKEAKQITLGVGVSGKEKDGTRLGWLEVDDAVLTPVRFPDGELRGICWHHPTAPKDEAECLEQIRFELDRYQQMGLNTIFYWTPTRYLATLDGVEGSNDARAKFGTLKRLIDEAHRRGMEVHAWYSPWIYKQISRAPELRLHPEWASVDRDGNRCNSGLCLSRPEVREFQLRMIRVLLDHHPDVDGVHIEEPGYAWTVRQCHCDYCKKTLRQIFDDENADRDQSRLEHWASFCSTDFMIKAGELVKSRRPSILFSANGSRGTNSDWHIGRDWLRWARFGYIDFYMPQVYTTSLNVFRRDLGGTQEEIGRWIPVVPVIGITWSSLGPKHNPMDTITAEIRAAREMGSPGMVFFAAVHVREDEVEPIGRVMKETTK